MTEQEFFDLAKQKCKSEFYLKRYIKFIFKYRDNVTGATENHHGLPKAADLFPEYKQLKSFPWNKFVLQIRAHFIAHVLSAKAFGGSQVYAIMQMVNKNVESAILSKRKNIKINQRVYDVLKMEWKKQLSALRTGKSRFQQRDGQFKIQLTRDDPIIEKLDLIPLVTDGKQCYYNKDGNIVRLLKQEVTADHKHVNSGMAQYIDSSGNVIRCSTDDPRVISGEFICTQKGREPSEEHRKHFSKIFTNTVCVIYQDGRKDRLDKNHPDIAAGLCFLNHGLGVKRKKTDGYKKQALERGQVCCIFCKKEVKINVFPRWHGDKCKMKETKNE